MPRAYYPSCLLLVVLSALDRPAQGAAAAAGSPVPANQLYALLINGGGDQQDNFASHLSHLRQFLALIERAKVPHDHVVILASDGHNPAPDLAVRDPEPEGSWLLEGTTIDAALRDTTRFENSTLPGWEMRPATLASLRRAVAELAGRLRAGDTLVLFVTDHGTDNPRDPLDNRITLWGRRESISVRALRSLLARLPRGTRTVALMSQCFSGGFGLLAETHGESGLPSGDVCGYFSSTADRPAYGCYPEVRGVESVGHAFEFTQALASSGHFAGAYQRILFADQSPDVPLRTSDLFLAEQLMESVPRAIKDEGEYLDKILHDAWASKSFSAERALADQLTASYGLPHLTDYSLREIDQRGERLAGFADENGARAKAWLSALGDVNQAQLNAFLDRKPEWSKRLSPFDLRKASAEQRRSLSTSLLAELVPFVESNAQLLPRLEHLIDSANALDEISYRAEVRLAALLRIRLLFLDVAARHYLSTQGRPAQLKALKALQSCEDLVLSLPPAPAVTAKAPLPALQEDERRAGKDQPAWLGFAFAPTSAGQRKQQHLPEGSIRVTSVLRQSPAALAGLRVGDILVAGAGQEFTAANPVRPAVALAPIGQEWPLELLRGKTRLTLRPRPQGMRIGKPESRRREGP